MENDVSRLPRQKKPREWWTILAVLGVFLLGLPGLFALPAEDILFNPDAYKQALAGQDIYNAMPLVLGDLLAQNSNRVLPGSGDQILSALEGARYEVVMRQIFPPAWVQAQAEGLIDQFWAYFNFQAPEFHLLVDLRQVKENLNGPGAPKIISAIVEGLPPCNAQDLLDYMLKAFSGEVKGLPLCRPPEQLLGLANQVVGLVVGGAAGLMPDQLDLASGLSVAQVLGGSRLGQAWGGLFPVYRVFRQLNPYLPWLALAGLGLVIWAAWRTERRPVFWSGAALVLPGLAVFFIALLLGTWLGQMIPFVLGQALGGQTGIMNGLVTALQQVSRRFTTVVMISALAVTVIGMLLVGWSIYKREKCDFTYPDNPDVMAAFKAYSMTVSPEKHDNNHSICKNFYMFHHRLLSTHTGEAPGSELSDFAQVIGPGNRSLIRPASAAMMSARCESSMNLAGHTMSRVSAGCSSSIPLRLMILIPISS